MKTNLDQLFKTNKDHEENGVKFAINDKTSFLVRRFVGTNPRVKAAMAAYYKPYARQMELGTLDEKKQQEIQRKLFVEICLVGWAGVEDEKGKEIPYTKDNALKVLEGLPDLFDTLWKHANDFASYRDDVGNS